MEKTGLRQIIGTDLKTDLEWGIVGNGNQPALSIINQRQS